MSNHRSYKTGAIIFAQGEKATEAFLIKSGSVRLTRQTPQGARDLDLLGQGGIFGESAFASEEIGLRFASAVAAEPTELVAINRDQWAQVLSRMPEIVRRYIEQLIGWLHQRPAVSFDHKPRYPITPTAAVLQLMAGATGEMEGDRVSPEAELDYDLVIKKLKEIIGLPNPLVETTLKRMESVNLVAIQTRAATSRRVSMDPSNFRQKVETSRRIGRVVVVPDPARIVTRARRLVEEWPELSTEGVDRMMDLEDFCQQIGGDMDIFLRKMAFGEVPSHLFLLHQDAALSWAKEQEAGFFKRSRRRTLAPEDIASLLDLVDVDDATLQRALGQVGVQNLGHALKRAPEEVLDKINSNLSKRMTSILKDQIDLIETPDRNIAADQEWKLLSAIRALKGLS